LGEGQVATKLKSQDIRLRVIRPVLLGKEFRLAVGVYRGSKKQLGVPLTGGEIQWRLPEFVVELSKDQLVDMGAKNVGSLLTVEYDITRYVRGGDVVEV
jgi:hypothetical protein